MPGAPVKPPKGEESLRAELESLPEASREDLADRWKSLYGLPPPKGISRRLLEFAVAYRIQEKALGGLKPATRRKLLRIAKAPRNPENKPPTPVSKAPAPGSRLIREWHGKIYTVDVLEDGFSLEGTHHPSLSSVARFITGARWSGPRFFGL